MSLQRPTCLATAILVSLTMLGACASRFSSATSRHERLVEDFRERIGQYMDLREDAVEDTDSLQSTSDPTRLTAEREALRAEIRRRRATARQGALFTSETRSLIRELLAPVLDGERGEDVRFRLNDDAPDINAVSLEVNARYPAGLPFPTTPWPILATLPQLPMGLSYRFVERDLMVLDQPADLIVDYMRNALPRTPAP